MATNLSFISLVFNIVVIDLTLSVTNAIGIGLSVAKAAPKYRFLVAVIGYFGAVAFRVATAVSITEVRFIPQAQTIINILLILVALDLGRSALWELRLESEDRDKKTRYNPSIRALLLICLGISLADLIDSSENVLAVAHFAAGNIGAITVGLSLSIAIVFLAGTVLSNFLSRLFERLSWLVDVNSLFVAFAAATLFTTNTTLSSVFPVLQNQTTKQLLVFVTIIITLVVDLTIRYFASRRTITYDPRRASNGVSEVVEGERSRSSKVQNPQIQVIISNRSGVQEDLTKGTIDNWR